MRPHQIDEIALIRKDAQSDYEKRGDKGLPDSLSDFRKIAENFDYENGKVLKEETLDDFDTAYEALRTGLELELKNFTATLLASNVENFAWAFVEPATEVFKDAWMHVLNKFTLRDVAIREQFLERMRILFRNIFLDKFNIKDEELALQLADAYFKVFEIAIHQQLDKMLENQEGETIPTAQDAKDEQGSKLTYR